MHDAIEPSRSHSRSAERGGAAELSCGLPRRVHLLGVGGAGVSGAARLLAARGHRPSGHDRARTPFLDGLADAGVEVAVGPSRAEDLPDDAGAVVRSAAVGLDDPQVVEAQRRGLPVLKYAELLPRLWRADRTAAVAGTHGKTTTTWMALYALEGVAAARGEGGGDATDGHAAPGALVGGIDLARGTNAVVPSKDGWFALEACEYDRSFLELSPRVAVITNVEADHLDCYSDYEGVVRGFARFARTVLPDGLLVLGADVPAAVEHAARCAVWRFGRELEFAHTSGGGFDLRGPGFALCDAPLAVPGRVMALDAAFAIALALGTLPIDERAAAAARAAAGVAAYRGAARRFERWGTFGERVLVHDYAHHPTELDAVLEQARAAYPDRPVHAYFQPHQHSRTAHLFDAFVDALARFDGVVLTEVYGARTHVDGAHFSGSHALAEALAARGASVAFEEDMVLGADRFARTLPERAVALVLGAGDIEEVRDPLERRLASAALQVSGS